MENQNKKHLTEKTKRAFLITQGASTKAYDIEELMTLGRSPENDICLQDTCVSPQHLSIVRTCRGFCLKDLQSTHGSFVNHTKVISCYLQEGDHLQVGNQHFVFTYDKVSSAHDLKPLTSRNKRWQRQLSQLPQISNSNFPVLITGPSGAGKEVITQWIHKYSIRREAPLINVNCSALSESLIESELFGHKRGSFTGADRDRKGAFQTAKGGTLFLDEIGDLPISLQPKLLRALENHEIKPVGSDDTQSTDVRVIAATHQSLKNNVVQNKFRADLFYRLNVLSIQIPPLRDHLEDFDDIIYKFAKKLRVRFSHGAIEKLKEHSWPGNIRELKNAVARAQAIYGQDLISDKDVKYLFDSMDIEPNKVQPLKDIEKRIICERLTYNMGNQKRTAEDLGMPKSTLHDRIKNYGIDIDKLLADRI